MLYTLNLHRAVRQLYLIKLKEKNKKKFSNDYLALDYLALGEVEF